MKKIVSILLVVIVLSSGFYFYWLLMKNNETEKLDMLSGIGSPGETWSTTTDNGQHEVVTYIKGEMYSPLRGAKNAQIKNVAKQNDGSTIYDIEYNFDEFGRREVIEPAETIPRKSFVAFFGCSDVLGVGVAPQDTLPSIFSQLMPDYKVYNYGFPGTAANYVNRILEITDWKKELPLEQGIFVYSMTEGHYPKTVRKIGHVIRPVMPFYTLDNGKLEYKGSLEDNNYIFANFETLFGMSPGLSELLGDPNDYTSYTENDHQLICSLLKSAQQNVFKINPKNRFIIHIQTTVRDIDREHLIKCAQKENIEYVDVKIPWDEKRHTTDPVYEHPSRGLNEDMAGPLAEYLKKGPKVE